MAHEIASTNGIHHFADSEARADGTVSAWHRLGQAVGHLMTVDEALDAAHMRGWEVRTEPLVANVGGVNLPVPNRNAVLRTNPINGQTEALGVVGNRWVGFQNEQTTGLLSALVDEGGAHIETLGALRGGRDTFATMKMPGHMTFTSPVTGEPDVTDLYISILNNHTGEAPLRALISPVRIVCANTQRIAEHSARSMVSLRHTGDPGKRLAEIRALLGLTFIYRDTFVEQCEGLIAKQMDGVQVLDVIEDVWGVKAATTEKQQETRKARALEVFEVYQNDATVAAFKGTAFGVYNAGTRYLDHVSPVAGPADASEEEKAIKRAQRTLMSVDLANLKGTLFSALAAV